MERPISIVQAVKRAHGAITRTHTQANLSLFTHHLHSENNRTQLVAR